MADSVFEVPEPPAHCAIELCGSPDETAIAWQLSHQHGDVGGGVAIRFMIRLVACAAGCTEQDLLSPNRGTRNVARARNVAIYLLHTRLSVRIGHIAGMLKRDRTTVAHACHQVEDSRDDPATDNFICELETMFDLALSLTIAE